ncbi:hypothetical protein TH53_16780 [Pedobacter lusitanus]|uniref:Contig73, whole genome shotgun sequence n=1 Tax=Pedobacter lusitanus TaxID=1503925 RepID=A0A0D0GFP7_9SPHI|nr:DUF6266 family protein [Pedobacter lusitanus]KIO76127.1 hypothetical protein TH53_16780 [Pedobacter lusitanus]
MAILKQGLIGTFTGKMGSLVISKWKNRYVGKSRPKASSKPATVLQLDYRSRFALIGQFLRRFQQIIPIGYQDSQVGTTPGNEAMKYNLLHAISGVYPDYKVDFASVKLSEPGYAGEIDGGTDPVLSVLPQAKIKLSWKNPARFNYPHTKDTDIAYAVFYHPEKKMSVYPTRPLRSKLELELDLPGMFLGEVHGWLFFGSADRKLVSHTQYLGKVTVIA